MVNRPEASVAVPFYIPEVDGLRAIAILLENICAIDCSVEETLLNSSFFVPFDNNVRVSNGSQS